MFINQVEKKFAEAQAVGQTTRLDVGSIKSSRTLAFVLGATVSTPANKTFASTAVDVTANTITLVAHGYALGLKVQISNPGTLPTGISAVTDYFVIPVDVDTFKLAASLVNANAGTAVDITAQGAGTNTVAATAIAGANAKIQKALEPAGPWFDEGSPTNITVTADLTFEKVDPAFKFYSVLVTLTAGQLTLTGRVLGRG